MNMKNFKIKKRWIAVTVVCVLIISGGANIWAQGSGEGDDEHYDWNRTEQTKYVELNTERFVSVGELKAGSPADEAELLPGDKILTVAGEIVTTDEAVETLVRRRSPESSVTVTVQRGDRELSFEITPVAKGLNKNYVGWDLDGLHNER